MYVCMYIYIYTHTYILDIHTYIHMCICICVCVYIYIYISTWVTRKADGKLACGEFRGSWHEQAEAFGYLFQLTHLSLPISGPPKELGDSMRLPFRIYYRIDYTMLYYTVLYYTKLH